MLVMVKTGTPGIKTPSGYSEGGGREGVL